MAERNRPEAASAGAVEAADVSSVLAEGLEAVFVVNPEGIVRWASRQAAEVVGVDFETIAGAELAAWFEDAHDVRTALARQDASVLDVHVRRPSGEVRRVEFRARPAGAHRVVALLDATQRDERHQERIRQADELLRIVRLLPDVIFSCYKADDGKIYWSLNEGKLAEEFGVTTEQIRGKPLEELFPGGASEHIRKEFEDAFAGTAKEWVNDMGGRYFKHFPQPVFGPDGEVEKVVGFISEVTSLKKAQEEIEALNAKLEQRVQELNDANQQLEAFAYTVSHDLRSPLTVMQTLLRALEIKYAEVLDADGRNSLGRLQAAAERMGQLIESLLLLSRASRQPIDRTDLDLSAMGQEVVAELRERDPDRDVETDIAPNLSVQADPRFARVLLDNLVGNAWKFTKGTEKARIEMGRTRDGAYYVRDNGPGFDPSEADRVFLAFERLDSAKGFEGTGIGLATVRRIVQRHGGRVWAEGRPGKGATFYFRFDPDEPEPAEAA